MPGASSRAVVFIGDSITAAGRDAAGSTDLGRGFVSLIADERRVHAQTTRASVVNRGIGGDRAVDVEARWDADCLSLDPAVITLLVGVNDTWRRFDHGQDNPVSEYSASLHRMLDAARARSSAALVVMEPFILEVGFVTAEWREDLAARQRAAAEVARRVGASFVPTQRAFDEAAGARPAALLHDGVPPTPAGHRLLADRWIAHAL